MTLAAATTIEYVAGDTMLLRHTIVDELGVAANITGDTIRMTVRREPEATPVLTTEDGSIVATITNGPGGVFTTKALPADTTDLDGTYMWQCELQDALGNKQTVTRGYLDFVPDLAP